jgi:tRNA pseudouridine38-40 synthase
MRNIKLTIEYDGTNYSGWQRQNSPQPSVLSRSQPKTIQETIEKALQKILQEEIRLIGSGRTDAGVHAKKQIANFKTNCAISLQKLQKALNSLLPDDIVIVGVKEVPLGFHSRFWAKSKVYRYAILNRKYPSCFLRHYTCFYPYDLDLEKMRQGARELLGRHNFKSFCGSAASTKNTVRVLKDIRINKRGRFIYIDIEAEGFLRNMARNIVGTLLEIGRGRSFNIKKLLSKEDRTQAGPTAAAKGLCLIKVKY